MRPDIQPHVQRPVEQQAELLVEDEQRSLLAAPHGTGSELQRQQRLAGAGGSEEQSARPALQAAAQQQVEGPDAARLGGAGELGPMFGSDEPRKYAQPAGPDDEIVVAAAECSPPIFGDAQPPPLGAVAGGQLLEPDHAMGYAMDGLVHRLGGQIIEEQDGGAAAVRRNA